MDRKEFLLKRENIPNNVRDSLNTAIYNNLFSLAELDSKKNIFTYISTKFEADTINLINTLLSQDKNIFVPCVVGAEMDFYKIQDLNNLNKSSMGILEPKPVNPVNPLMADAFIVPGVIFDENCHRVGYGRGYYDRYLAKNINALKIGICYNIQLVKNVVHKPHDIDMDILITDKQIIKKENLK